MAGFLYLEAHHILVELRGAGQVPVVEPGYYSPYLLAHGFNEVDKVNNGDPRP